MGLTETRLLIINYVLGVCWIVMTIYYIITIILNSNQIEEIRHNLICQIWSFLGLD